jgi:hypothetical protein
MTDRDDIGPAIRAMQASLAALQADVADLKARPDTALLMQFCERIIAEHRSFGGKLDRIIDDMHNLKARASNAERQDGEINGRLDHIDLRLERIEHRLELVEPPR